MYIRHQDIAINMYMWSPVPTDTSTTQPFEPKSQGSLWKRGEKDRKIQRRGSLL